MFTFADFINDIYSYYHRAPKLTATLKNKTLALEQEFYIFDSIYRVRWIASELSALE